MEGETAKVGTTVDVESQGGGRNGWTRKLAAELSRRPGQVAVPAYSRADTISHIFWKQGTTTMFEIIFSDLDAGSYLRMTPKNYIAKA